MCGGDIFLIVERVMCGSGVYLCACACAYSHLPSRLTITQDVWICRRVCVQLYGHAQNLGKEHASAHK